MATIAEYLALSKAAYATFTEGAHPGRFPLTHPLAEWRQIAWQNSRWYNDGLQGGIFESRDSREVIVVFSGTQGNASAITQYASNARILFQAIPNVAGKAYGLVLQAIQKNGSQKISITGHSLGGALAQVVGFWTGRPFVSFNGPGMRRNLISSRYNLLQRNQRMRTRRAGSVNDAVGLSFTVASDTIGGFGDQLGTHIILSGVGSGTHFPNSIDARLDENANKVPADLCPGWAERH